MKILDFHHCQVRWLRNIWGLHTIDLGQPYKNWGSQPSRWGNGVDHTRWGCLMGGTWVILAGFTTFWAPRVGIWSPWSNQEHLIFPNLHLKMEIPREMIMDGVDFTPISGFVALSFSSAGSQLWGPPRDYGSYRKLPLSRVGSTVLVQVIGSKSERYKNSPPNHQQIASYSHWQETKLYKALLGVRGMGSVDMDQLIQIMVRFSVLILDLPEIAEPGGMPGGGGDWEIGIGAGDL